ncbi:MAG: hypothetical protein Q9187_004103 [Circinaria calcarea]
MPSGPDLWFCSYCSDGPLSIILQDFCPICSRRRTKECTLEYSGGSAVPPSGPFDRQAQLVPQDEVIEENPSFSAAHKGHVTPQKQIPPSVTRTDQDESFRKQSASSRFAHPQSFPEHAAAKSRSSSHDSVPSSEQTFTKHGIKSSFTAVEGQTKIWNSEGNILEGSRFGSTSAASLLEYYLFNQENPVSEDLFVYAVRLPGESSFSAVTGEPATRAPRRPLSPNSRAQTAHTRNNGGSCTDCRKKKKRCSHVLQELEAIINGDSMISPPGVAENVQQSTSTLRTLAPAARDGSIGQNEASARLSTFSAGVRLPPRRQRQRRPTSRRNFERGNAIFSPRADDQSFHAASPRSEGSDVREIRNSFPHTSSPFAMPITIQGRDYVEHGHNVGAAHETNYAYINNSRGLRDLPPNRMIREPARMLPAINEALLESSGHPSVDVLSNAGSPSAFPYSEQLQNTAVVNSTIENPIESHWLPLPTYQGTSGTENVNELFNMASISPLQNNPRQGSAPMDYQQHGFMSDEGFRSSTSYLPLDAESTGLYSESVLLDQLSAENEAGYCSQSLEMGMAASPSYSYRPLRNISMSVRPQLGEPASIRSNASGGNSDFTTYSENTMSISSGFALTPKSNDSIESIDPRLLSNS